MKHTSNILFIATILLLVIQVVGMVLKYSRDDKKDELINKYALIVKEYEQLTRDLKKDLDGCRGVLPDTIVFTDVVISGYEGEGDLDRFGIRMIPDTTANKYTFSEVRP